MKRMKSLGFSMIELMIAMAIGLVVIGSVLAFTMSSLNTNTEYVQATRLSQELRGTMDMITRDLRRAGYDQDIMRYIAASKSGALLPPSPFGPIFINDDNDCVIYSYDREDGTSGVIDLARGEVRGFRRVVVDFDGTDVGVIEMAESAAGVVPDCDGDSPDYTNYPVGCDASGWCALSDPRVLNVISFTLDTDGYITKNATATSTSVVMREVGVSIEGGLRQTQDAVVRGIRSTVKIRSDCLDTEPDCTLVPGS
jgi:prepilin-type N-terminal cleavage/methylation domain-containing protein